MDRFTEVSAALQPYFDGLYESDTRKLAQIFHPGAIYACATSGELLRLDMAEYFKVVDKRPASTKGFADVRQQLVEQLTN